MNSPSTLGTASSFQPTSINIVQTSGGTAIDADRFTLHQLVSLLNSSRRFSRIPSSVKRQTVLGRSAQSFASTSRSHISEDRRRYPGRPRSEEHTSELQSLLRTSYAVFCLQKKTTHTKT